MGRALGGRRRVVLYFFVDVSFRYLGRTDYTPACGLVLGMMWKKEGMLQGWKNDPSMKEVSGITVLDPVRLPE